MKRFTEREFLDLLESPNWEHKQTHELIDDNIFSARETFGYEENERRSAYGEIKIESTLGNYKIIYQEQYSFDGYDTETLDISSDGWDEPNCIFEGFIVVDDDDGEEIDPDEFGAGLPDDFNVFCIEEIEKEIKDLTEIDLDEGDEDMETYTLESTLSPDLKFTGELLGCAASTADKAYPNYSGEVGRWTELSLYKTKGGKYVCHRENFTQWQGDRNTSEAKVCDSIKEVIEFFGHDWLAKRLYADAEIEDVLEVE